MKTTMCLLAVTLGAISGLNAQDTAARAVASYEPYARIEFAQPMAWSPDDRQIIYSNGNRQGAKLYIVSSNGGTPRPFLSSPTVEVLPGWPPDGARVAFVSYRGGAGGHIWTSDSSGGDLRQATPFPVNGSARMVWSADGERLAMVWDVNGRIMIVPPSGGDPKPFASGATPALSPDGKRVAYYAGESQESSRPFNVLIPGAEIRLWIKPVDGGASKYLRSVDYNKPDIGPAGLSLDWSPDGKRLLTTKPVNGSWQLAVVNVDEDRVELTLPVNGSARNPRWSHDGKRIAYDWEDTGHPARLEVLTLDGRQTTQLTQSAAYTTAQLVRYRAGNGIEIPGWLYSPRNPDQARHPALIWLHGMPSNTTNIFAAPIQYLVDQGFVVLVVNYGLSSGFGNERRMDSSSRLDDFLSEPKAATATSGTVLMMPDIFASVDYLKTLKSVDPSRIGIAGHSHGGYLTLRSIVAQPGLFSAAVDISGVSDSLSHYREHSADYAPVIHLIGGAPEGNREGYRAASPIHFVERIKTPLLILHGSADQMVLYHHSADMAEALEREKKQYEFIAYKGAGHIFGGKDEVDANQQILRFLLAHLETTKPQ